MNKTLLSAALAATCILPQLALAQSAPASPHTLTGNLGFVTDYRFRGISQTFEQPAIQGGIDYSHASGFYAGTWASNVYGGASAQPLGVAYFNGSMGGISTVASSSRWPKISCSMSACCTTGIRERSGRILARTSMTIPSSTSVRVTSGCRRSIRTPCPTISASRAIPSGLARTPVPAVAVSIRRPHADEQLCEFRRWLEEFVLLRNQRQLSAERQADADRTRRQPDGEELRRF